MATASKKIKLDEGQRCRLAVEAAKIGPETVAAKIGYSPQTVKRWMQRFGITSEGTIVDNTDEIASNALLSTAIGHLPHEPRLKWSGMDNYDNSLLGGLGKTAASKSELFDPEWISADDDWDSSKNNASGVRYLFKAFESCGLYDEELDEFMDEFLYRLSLLEESERPYTLADDLLAESDDPRVQDIAEHLSGMRNADGDLIMNSDSLRDLAQNAEDHLAVGYMMYLESRNITDYDEGSGVLHGLVNQAKKAAE